MKKVNILTGQEVEIEAMQVELRKEANDKYIVLVYPEFHPEQARRQEFGSELEARRNAALQKSNCIVMSIPVNEQIIERL